jgi:large subunit ribosomal protein L25
MKSKTLTSFPRTQIKRSGVKKLRSLGRIPAVLYGRHNAPRNIELVLKDVDYLLRHTVCEHTLVDLSIEEGENKSSCRTVIREIQRHPVNRRVQHIDFQEVAEDELITITVPVEPIGEADGVRNGGGVLSKIKFELNVRAVPGNLPEMITVDVTDLKVDETISVGDIEAPEGVEILGNKSSSVFSVTGTRLSISESAAAEEEQSEAEEEEESTE